MNVTAFAKWTGTVLLLLTLGACGGSDDGDAGGGSGGGGAPPVSAVIGPAGGTVIGPNGASVVIPAGALATDTAIGIEQTSAGSPALPGAFSTAGAMFAFTPHGTTFAVPVTVTLPFDPATIAAGRSAALFKTNAANQWEQVANATFGANTVSAQVTSFSWWVLNGLRISDPVREWSFGVFPGNSIVETRIDGAIAPAGDLEVFAEFGPAVFDKSVESLSESLPPDRIATGAIFSTANGVTFSVLAEAPDGRFGTAEPIGSVSRMKQRQSFIKLADNATFKFTLTNVIIDVIDFNPPVEDASALIKGEVLLSVAAYKSATPSRYFYQVAGKASLWGERGAFIPSAYDESFATTHLWDPTDFNVTRDDGFKLASNTSCIGQRATMVLKKEMAFFVDLSSVGVGEEFTVRIDTYAEAKNRKGGGSQDDCLATFASAYLRDPSEIGGGTLLETSGLEPTNRPLPEPPVGNFVEPAACVPGPGPLAGAGTLQFDAASYRIDEFAGAVSTVTVTRTGGSTGAVSATFTTSDGTAIGGTDYTPLTTTVFFGDGDTSPRVVTVPIIDDVTDEIDKTVNLTLSQPGGCAALGAQTTAVLTIRDDDLLPTQPSGFDPTFDTDGKATTTAFGGDRSGMALQADGKIVMVGGTFTDFVLARFNANGSIDTSFGVDGKVITDMGSGLRQEEALAVAIQPDGKIVVVGYTSIPNVPPNPRLPDTFALARYNSNGSLDTSFGTGGRVSSNVNGRAFAVAIQGDGKIVAAGEVSLPSTSGLDFSDFVVARFNTNGSLDASFGIGGTGQVVTDFGNVTNSASNLVLQPNGSIVASGKPQGSQPGFDHTDMARYNRNGGLDTSFGSGGKLTLAGVDVGQGLARQADGQFVLVGSVTETTVPATARFLLKRLNADGSPDTTFGNAGTVDTAFSSSAAAGGVALQGDGKIVVVGTSAFSVNANFVVARYNADGSVDRGFGSDGNLTVDFFGFSDVGENVLMQPDGKIVVGGLARNNVDGYGLARILP